MTQVSAPGKLMIVGEYAVLEGCEAVVSAISRRAYAHYSASLGNHSPSTGNHSAESEKWGPEIMLSLKLAQEKIAAKPARLTMNLSTLYESNQKLGFGSSAAGAAAATAAVFAEGGRDLDDHHTKQSVFEVALAGHQAVSAHGSGADVAASVFGGMLRFKKKQNKAVTQRFTLAASLKPSVVFTKQSARTNAFIDRIHALKQSDPSRYEKCIHDLNDCAQSFIAANETGHIQQSLQAYAEHHHALARLGEAAHLPIVTEPISTIVGLAESHHGACKASGAGGGDCCLAFFSNEDDQRAFQIACTKAGFEVLDVSLAAPGVRREIEA